MTHCLAPVLLPALLLLSCSGGRGEPAISPPWKPIVPVQLSTRIVHRPPGAVSHSYVVSSTPATVQEELRDVDHDQCALYKVVMSQQLYFEYIHYKTDLPDLKEFTLCMWTKFTNHSNDHPLFSYAVGDQPRSILSWVANTPRSSYYMMNIDGHNLYRLNYPLRLNRWYHSCQSWNGRTGEWQIWVNDERVGRGFNNRLVGHVIKGGGVAISGQEQRQIGGGFLEGEGAPAGSGGMLGELTMVQLYGVALTAGKAHRDHKHHHAHHFEHDTSNNVPQTTTTQAPITGPPLPMNPYLTGGQLNHQVKINPGAHIQIVQNGLTLRHPALPVPSEIPQPLPPAILTSPSLPTPTLPTSILSSGSPVNGFSFIDRRYRQFSVDRKRKRALVYAGGTLVDDTYVQPASQLLTEAGYLTGLANFGQGMITNMANSELNAEDDAEAEAEGQQEVEREPAEEEVRRVMDLCDGCAEEPFNKALVFGWRNVPKKLYSGALHVPALPVCKAF